MVENGATSTWVDRKWVARNFDWAVIARQVERIVRDEAS